MAELIRTCTCAKGKNVAVLTCAKEKLQSVVPNVIVQTRRASQGCVIAEEASVSDVYSGGILDSGPPIPEGVWRLQ